ncbi:hypothetical protein FHR90_001969 [Endobacter medicaginis]|uniref:Uncharacterized protein n=1 Tax=Endobacter medicaginis TaxID=1181271 RepID=A0A850NYZ2_9PROT|nr:hypothetical protein [Endobacter medicaginis]MBB3174133.1 hypothetical protein [Endobacter medicaginis]MCX5474177.1 hypothetical protein [Endobacter medicaginis]NVN31087.1 hypothetical protein [Endobacter medicaginis]
MNRRVHPLASVNTIADPDRGRTFLNIASGVGSLAAAAHAARIAGQTCIEGSTVGFRRLDSLSQLPPPS